METDNEVFMLPFYRTYDAGRLPNGSQMRAVKILRRAESTSPHRPDHTLLRTTVNLRTNYTFTERHRLA